MNILPKKRWHVRTKDNIARVRRDEALAAEQAKAKEEKIFIADQEAKINFLRQKARQRFGGGTTEENGSSKTDTNIEQNILKSIEESDLDYKKDNAEYLKDKKEEKEKYEKQIGYLTYLGQDTNEALGKKNWYDVAPNRDKSDIEVNVTKKLLDDPLHVMQSYLGKRKEGSTENKLNTSESSTAKKNKYDKYRKHKNRKYENSSDEEDVEPKNKKMKLNKSTIKDCKLKEKSNKKNNIEMLRAERLKREKEEKARAQALLYQIKNPEKNKVEEKSSFKQKFSSQYNPDVAKQNYT